MLDTYIKNRGMTKTIIHKNNHNIINETNWDADYDGSVANISLDLSKNGRNKHLDFKLTNDDLANMLSIPSVSQPIHKRLKMDFVNPKSFEEVFLELEPDSHSDLPLENMETLFYNNDLENDKQSRPIQELLTHISSPKLNEEFIMPFQDYSLQPVIKIVHKPSKKTHRKSKKSASSHKFSHRINSRKLSSRKLSSRKLSHHNYPSTRKSSRRHTSRRS